MEVYLSSKLKDTKTIFLSLIIHATYHHEKCIKIFGVFSTYLSLVSRKDMAPPHAGLDFFCKKKVSLKAPYLNKPFIL